MAAIETSNAIIELKDALFSILIDESCDISIKGKIIVALHYVDQ